MSPIYSTSSKKNATGDFENCPAGTHVARLVDVSEPFEGVKEYQGVKKSVEFVTLAWQVSEAMSDGRPFIVTNRYTNSTYTTSRLYPVVCVMLGRQVEEGEVVDLEEMIGKDCLIAVAHNPDKNDKTKVWANVQGVMALPKGMPPMPTAEYVRWKDREKKPKWWPEHKDVQSAKEGAAGHGWDGDKLDSDIPF